MRSRIPVFRPPRGQTPRPRRTAWPARRPRPDAFSTPPPARTAAPNNNRPPMAPIQTGNRNPAKQARRCARQFRCEINRKHGLRWALQCRLQSDCICTFNACAARRRGKTSPMGETKTLKAFKICAQAPTISTKEVTNTALKIISGAHIAATMKPLIQILAICPVLNR